MKKIYIGIDPGVNTGFAVWHSREQKFSTIETLTFWECIESLNGYVMQQKRITPSTHWQYELIVVIEDVTQNRPTFNRFMDRKSNEKISQNVGSNKRDCQLIIEWCEKQNIEVIRVRPSKKTFTKLKSEQFKLQTGWEERTSSHSRDAAMLVWQR